MPVKLRKAKQGKYRITPEAVAAFESGDARALARALGLPPWVPNPIETVDPHPPAWAERTAWGDLWGEMWALRVSLLRGVRGG